MANVRPRIDYGEHPHPTGPVTPRRLGELNEHNTHVIFQRRVQTARRVAACVARGDAPASLPKVE